MDSSNLGSRMKEYYEAIPKIRLMRRMPVAIRIDGKAFHTFTRGFAKPFDEVLGNAMVRTMEYLCKNIQGAVFGFTQSDEITLLLIDYQTFETDAWFDYEVQKMCSIAASMTTMAFNKFFMKNVDEWGYSNLPNYSEGGTNEPVDEKLMELCNCYWKAIEKGAMFDARVFNVPKEEVTNCVYWRQLDASRNSIQMVGQANFSHKELQNKSCSMIQDILMIQKGINWNDLPTYQKRGSCVIKEEYLPYEPAPRCENCEINAEDIRTRWIIDKDIPIFKGEGREYIEKLINFD